MKKNCDCGGSEEVKKYYFYFRRKEILNGWKWKAGVLYIAKAALLKKMRLDKDFIMTLAPSESELESWKEGKKNMLKMRVWIIFEDEYKKIERFIDKKIKKLEKGAVYA